MIAASLAANAYFALFLVIGAFGLVFGYFTIRGSGINNHPSDGRDGAPGAKLPDEFHQFADRQLHEADVRHARHAQPQVATVKATAPAQASAPADEMTLDDINRRLAAEAKARKPTDVHAGR